MKNLVIFFENLGNFDQKLAQSMINRPKNGLEKTLAQLLPALDSKLRHLKNSLLNAMSWDNCVENSQSSQNNFVEVVLKVSQKI